MPVKPVAKRRLHLPTVSVALAIHGGFILWSLSYTLLTLWLAAPLGSLLHTADVAAIDA